MSTSPFSFNPPDGWQNATEFPEKSTSATQVRGMLQRLHSQTRDFINSVILPAIDAPIGTAKLASKAVTTAKLDDGAVTADKLAGGIGDAFVLAPINLDPSSPLVKTRSEAKAAWRVVLDNPIVLSRYTMLEIELLAFGLSCPGKSTLFQSRLNLLDQNGEEVVGFAVDSNLINNSYEAYPERNWFYWDKTINYYRLRQYNMTGGSIVQSYETPLNIDATGMTQITGFVFDPVGVTEDHPNVKTNGIIVKVKGYQ